MAKPIHQLYCTHCTYGTAAQHRHTGNVRNQPFEYSTRATSGDMAKAHETFQKFEKQFFRGIPMAGDAIVEIRRMSANEAPWRKLMFLPSVEGMQVLAHVCYRTKDTSGRLGSYFAHVLVQELAEGERPWNPAECLKLWGAKWETVDREVSDASSDAARDSFQLEPRASLDDRDFGYECRVNDMALKSFLTSAAEPASRIDAPPTLDSRTSVFPARWREKTPEARTQLLIHLLSAVLGLDIERHERLTIAVEPGVAALLFYGITRLLPPEGLVQQLSFSTFESHLDKSSTVLTAHDFADPNVTDLLPETYRGKGCAINTYRREQKLDRPEARYAEMMVRKFIDEGPESVDRMRSQIAVAGPAHRDRCESIATLYERIKNSVYADTTSPTLLSGLSSSDKTIAAGILSDVINSASVETLKSVAKKSTYLQVLKVISSLPGNEAARQASLALVKALPPRDDVRNAFFASIPVSQPLKLAVLKSILKGSGQFPRNCPSLFDVSAKGNGVLAELLKQTTADQVKILQKLAPAEFGWNFAAALAVSASSDPQKGSLLLNQIEGLDDDALCKLFDRSSGCANLILNCVRNSVKLDQDKFVRRMEAFIAGFRQAPPDQIVDRVEWLIAVSPGLPFQKNLIDRWVKARDAVRHCGQSPASQGNGALDASLAHAFKAIATALSDLDTVVTPLETDLALVEALLRGWLRADQAELREQLVKLLPRLQLSSTDDVELCTFVAGPSGAAWLRKYPRNDPALPQRLQSILEELPDNFSSFHIRLNGLLAASPLLGAVEQQKCDVWRRINEQLKWFKRQREQVKYPSEIKGSDELQFAARALGQLLYQVMSDQIAFDPSQPTTRKLKGAGFLENLSVATIEDKTITENKFILRLIEVQIESEFEAHPPSKGSGKRTGFFSK